MAHLNGHEKAMLTDAERTVCLSFGKAICTTQSWAVDLQEPEVSSKNVPML